MNGPRAIGSAWLPVRRGLLLVTGLMVMFPFLVSIVVDGQGIGAVLANDEGNARFLQGLAIEIFILALYALSYDLILGVTGLLSFGHAMFFAVGSYTFGIMLKTLELGWPAALAVVLVAAVLQALLFGVVLTRGAGHLVRAHHAGDRFDVLDRHPVERPVHLRRSRDRSAGYPHSGSVPRLHQRAVHLLPDHVGHSRWRVRAVHADRRLAARQGRQRDPRQRGPGTHARVQHAVVQAGRAASSLRSPPPWPGSSTPSTSRS